MKTRFMLFLLVIPLDPLMMEISEKMDGWRRWTEETQKKKRNKDEEAAEGRNRQRWKEEERRSPRTDDTIVSSSSYDGSKRDK